MHLKQLEILGFKSFAHKTTIRFSDGVTAIVGPNGCGKTNVLDSLRWVLGEQKVSLLRGGKMDEVIFNGTRDTKALNMAEVTLTIVNDRGVLPTEYNELQIARRLFRSGESEYLLNRVPCRRKDIIDLFLDTGMGAHSYSVIQMDMIDAVLSDKPEERRFLFEEAAGITKYKQRKKAALRKLEATENDFLRLRDIHSEVKTRVNSLFRQHKKAERYQKIGEDIRKWELFLASGRIRRIETQKRELKAKLDALSSDRIGRETTLDRVSAQLEAERKELIDIERQLNEVANEIYSTSEDAHSLEKEISIAREKRANAGNLISKNEADIESMKYRAASLTEQADRHGAELVELRRQYEAVCDDLKSAEEAQAEADRRLLTARTSKDDENKKMIELEGKLSSGRTEEQNLQEQEDDISRQLSETRGRLEANKPRQDALMADLSQAQENLDRLQQLKADIEDRRKAARAEMEQLDGETDDLAAEMANLSASIEACQARRNLLEDMMLQYEGYESGLVAVMELRDRWPQIAGTVAEKLVPVEGLESALEVALGDLAKCLICYERETAEDIIRYLKAEKKGRTGILVPNTGALAPGVKRPEINLPVFVGWLDSFVSTDERLRPLMESVLSRTAVFRAGSSPDQLLKLLPYGFCAVSTDGVLFTNNMISGGSDDRFPLFRRKEKVQEQETMIAELTEKLEAAGERKGRAEARIAALRAESVKLGSQTQDTVEEIEQAQKKRSELDFERRTLTSEFERLEKEAMQYSGKLEGIKNRQYDLGLDFSDLTTQKKELMSTMHEAGSQVEDLERAATAAVERVSRLHVALIETRSKVEQTESQITHVIEIRGDLEMTMHVKVEEIEQARHEIESSSERMQKFEEELKSHFERRERHTARQNSLRANQSEVMERVNNKEKEIKRTRDERENLREEIHQHEIRLNSIDSEIKGIRDRILDEYEIDINAVEVERPDEKLTDEEAPEYLQKQKERLKGFGAVNLLALEEYQTANERQVFLDEQLTDLSTAKRDLQTTIGKINQTARQLFHETFTKVRGNFQSLFVELFNGGEADIRLEDETDPLESNIEIIARPRGKKILSIAQMSGGERALTAISLLFSLYLVKPSPFCILDEIDAPLDDANCHRFLKIIKNFSDQTQFITITHNKITMEAADNLYGITMEEAGISKLVAVKFTEGDEYTVLDRPEERAAEIETDAPVSESDPTISSLPEHIQERINPSVNISADDED